MQMQVGADAGANAGAVQVQMQMLVLVLVLVQVQALMQVRMANLAGEVTYCCTKVTILSVRIQPFFPMASSQDERGTEQRDSKENSNNHVTAQQTSQSSLHPTLQSDKDYLLSNGKDETRSSDCAP